MNDNLTNETNRIYSLQVLRAISALAVLLHHVKGYSNIVGGKTDVIYNLIPSIFGYGATLFFGISGFLMAYLIDTNYKNFLFRRALRIYPPYIIAVMIIIALKFILLGTKPQTNDLLLSLSLLPVGRITYTLNIEWTLIYEVFYYLICSIFTFKYLKTFYPFFLILWGIAICFGFFYFKIPTEFLTSINNIPFSTINYFFIFGGLVYYMKRMNFVLPQKINYILLFISVIFIFVTYYYFINLRPMIIKIRYPIMGILFSTLIYFVLSIEFKHKKILADLGDYSYGIYLVHASILAIFLTLWKDKFGLPVNNIASTIAFILALIAGWYYGRFDFTLHNYLKKLKIQIDTRTLYKTGIAVASISSIFVGYNVWQYNKVITPEQCVVFDNTKVILSQKSAGWIDIVSPGELKIKDKVSIQGWAIDPYTMTPAKNVLLVSGERIIPAQDFSWYARDALAKVLNSPGVVMSGWKMTIDPRYLGNGLHEIDVYAVTGEDKYIRLNKKPSAVINVI